MTIFLALWSLLKASKLLDYLAAGFGLLVTAGAALLASFAKGKKAGRNMQLIETLSAEAAALEKANAASAVARADGAGELLRRGCF